MCPNLCSGKQHKSAHASQQEEMQYPPGHMRAVEELHAGFTPGITGVKGATAEKDGS